MTDGRLVLVGGGARSGKSAFALTRAQALGTRRVFVATAQAFDDEMRARITRHRDERAGTFLTIEEPLSVPETLAHITDADVVLIDCLTLWLSNLLLAGQDEAAIDRRVEELIASAQNAPFTTVIVTNEVGMGVVPESALGRLFRDVAGRAHQRLARAAHELYLATLGVVIRLRPEPLALVTTKESP